MSDVKEKMICPVCKAEQSDEMVLACAECKFMYSYVRFFANIDSKNMWQEKVEEYIEASKTSKYRNAIRSGVSSVGFLNSESHELIVIHGNGMGKEVVSGVSQYISNKNNTLILFDDGRVSVTGDNQYGQCNVSGGKDIHFCEISNTCLFMINNDGKVIMNGTINGGLRETVGKWSDIDTIAANEDNVVGVTRKGNVLVAMLNANERSALALLDKDVNTILSWQGVKKVALKNGCCVALHNDGKISIAGSEVEAIKEASTWLNIDDFIFDGTYVVGITLDSEVRAAGQAKSKFFDRGRSAVYEWKEMAAVSCSENSICGYDVNGNLYLAGNFSGNNEGLIEEWNREIKDICLGKDKGV